MDFGRWHMWTGMKRGLSLEKQTHSRASQIWPPQSTSISTVRPCWMVRSLFWILKAAPSFTTYFGGCVSPYSTCSTSCGSMERT